MTNKDSHLISSWIFILTFLLIGCNNENNNFLDYNPDDTQLPPKPYITKIDIQIERNNPSLSDVNLLSDIDCARCDPSKYSYTWIVNGMVVSNNATYTPTKAYDIDNVRLEVSGQDTYGQLAQMQYVVYSQTKVIAINSNDTDFSALKNDGSVVIWGDSEATDSNNVDFSGEFKTIYSNGYAFAAIKNNGSVVTWGDQSRGGDSNQIDFTGGVKTIYSNYYAFAAIKNDGSVVTWGDQGKGGDSSKIDFTGGVKSIFPNKHAFAAIKNDGSVVTWGDNGYGGNSDTVKAEIASDVQIICSTANAFSALKQDGSVVNWGSGVNDGNTNISQVKSIYSTAYAFAALRTYLNRCCLS
ncbi:MAG: hypothetical protein ACRCYF_09315 [Shewanella sp.]